MKPFKEGFVTFEKTEDDGRVLYLRKPTLFLSKTGVGILNNGAMLLLMGKGEEFKALRLGYNPHTKVLALKPEKEHIGYPETIKISRVGEYRRAGQISFKNLANLFDMEFTGKRYLIAFNKTTGVAEVDLKNPLREGERPKRMRLRKTVSRKLEETDAK